MATSNTNQTHKIKATDEQIKEMIAYYDGYLTNNASPYIIARAKTSSATITFYKTNVVLFQGESEGKEYNQWAKKYQLPIDESSSTEEFASLKGSCFGSDEVGTGDYFGPIVVCSCYVSEENIQILKSIGVKDSKLLTDKQMIPLGLKIAQIIPYSLIILSPDKFNALQEKYTNLNFLKAYLHNKAINSILKKCEKVKYDAIIIDEFTPKEKYFEYLKDQSNVVTNVTMIPKGEKASIAVAAASVLARVAFLREMSKYSSTYGQDILKGAGPEVDRCAISFVKSKGWNELKNIAKLKFANTNRIINYFETNPLPNSKIGSFEMDKLKYKNKN